MRSQSHTERGVALVETVVALGLIILVVAAGVEMGIRITLYSELQQAAREGARVAAGIPALTANHSNVMQSVDSRIQYKSLMSGISITNTAPFDGPAAITDHLGNRCDKMVTVTVSATQSFSLKRIALYSGPLITASTTMRYLAQPLCT